MVPGDCANYAETRAAIVAKLEALRDNPNQSATPLIYHLDVAAMYPNIILTNRLQPPAMVTEDVCAACDYNRPGKTCLREMEWLWRGEHYAASSSDYSAIKAQLEAEKFPPRADPFGPEDGPRYWADLSHEEQQAAKKARLKMYSQKVYKRVLDKPVTQERVAGMCQRENGFYVDTVLNFRDRRYVYKGLNKKWKGKLGRGEEAGEPDRDPGSQRHGDAVRFVAARTQVHPQLVLRVRHAQGRAVVFHGDGGRRDVHRREDHPDGQEAGGRHRQAPRAGHGRHLVLSARDFPEGVHPAPTTESKPKKSAQDIVSRARC